MQTEAPSHQPGRGSMSAISSDALRRLHRVADMYAFVHLQYLGCNALAANRVFVCCVTDLQAAAAMSRTVCVGACSSCMSEGETGHNKFSTDICECQRAVCAVQPMFSCVARATAAPAESALPEALPHCSSTGCVRCVYWPPLTRNLYGPLYTDVQRCVKAAEAGGPLQLPCWTGSVDAVSLADFVLYGRASEGDKCHTRLQKLLRIYTGVVQAAGAVPGSLVLSPNADFCDAVAAFDWKTQRSYVLCEQIAVLFTAAGCDADLYVSADKRTQVLKLAHARLWMCHCGGDCAAAVNAGTALWFRRCCALCGTAPANPQSPATAFNLQLRRAVHVLPTIGLCCPVSDDAVRDSVQACTFVSHTAQHDRAVQDRHHAFSGESADADSAAPAPAAAADAHTLVRALGVDGSGCPTDSSAPAWCRGFSAGACAGLLGVHAWQQCSVAAAADAAGLVHACVNAVLTVPRWTVACAAFERGELPQDQQSYSTGSYGCSDCARGHDRVCPAARCATVTWRPFLRIPDPAPADPAGALFPLRFRFIAQSHVTSQAKISSSLGLSTQPPAPARAVLVRTQYGVQTARAGTPL